MKFYLFLSYYSKNFLEISKETDFKRIIYKEKDGKIFITIDDNGIGREEAAAIKKQKLGFKNEDEAFTLNFNQHFFISFFFSCFFFYICFF